MDSTALAYLAGAMDSDGYFTIKRSTYHTRVRKDASNPVFSEKVGLKQVTPDIPSLLRDSFGGTLGLARGQSENSKSLHYWHATDLKAARACELLLPYLRVKKQQASLLLELRESKQGHYEKAAYWFALENPDWHELELITYAEAAQLLGHTNLGSLSQAVQNGSLLALPYGRSRKSVPRVPRSLIDCILATTGKDGRARCRPRQLIEWRQSLYERVKELNKIGVNGTPVFHRTGAFAQLE